MVMRHGCARGTGEKLTEFLIAQTHGRAVAKRPHCTDAWERRDHVLIRVGEHSEFKSSGPKVLDSHVKHKLKQCLNTKLKQQQLRITYQTHILAWGPLVWVFKQQTILLKMGYQTGPKFFRCFAVNAYKVTTTLYSSLLMCLKVHPQCF